MIALRKLLYVSLAFLMAGCALDRETPLREDLAEWLYLGETRHFLSEYSCTVGIFDLARMTPRPNSLGPARVYSLDQAMRMINAGRSVVFEIDDLSPTEVSERVMSANLSTGLGLLSSGVGPTLSCMPEDSIKLGVYRILISPEASLAYLPEENAILLLYPPEKLAVFLRGTV